MLNTSLFKKGSTVAVALSGGKDSVCLLDMLLKNSAALCITVRAINVEHGIRGENSLRDTEFVKTLCAQKNVPVLCFSVNAPERAGQRGESLEQAARALRYDCFLNAISSGFCDFIATAHHQSDNAETVLLNLIRGTSLKGLCGISEKALGGKIIRPVLSLSREELDDYARANGLKYVTDETNFSLDYSRNFLRGEIIPRIKERFPHFENAVSRMCESLKSDDEALDFYAKKLVRFEPSDGSVRVKIDFAKDFKIDDSDELKQDAIKQNAENQKAIFSRACIIAFKRIGFVADYTSAHIGAIYNLCFLQTGASADLKNNVKAYKEQNEIVFITKKQKSGAISPQAALSIKKSELSAGKKLYFGDYKIEFLSSSKKQFENAKKSRNVTKKGFVNELFFDLDKLPDEITIRFRETGDEIISFGGERKSLKKYFTDKKISARVSDELPLIANGKKIYLVAKVDVSCLLKIDETTENIVKFICYKKGEQPTDV